MTFRVIWVWVGMVQFGSISGQLIFGQIRSSCQNKQLCRKFRVGYGSIRVNSGFGSTFGWAYFECRVAYGSGSLRSSFRSVLSGLMWSHAAPALLVLLSSDYPETRKPSPVCCFIFPLTPQSITIHFTLNFHFIITFFNPAFIFIIIPIINSAITSS